MRITKPRLIAFCHTGLYSGSEVVLERVLRAAARDGWHVTALVPKGLAQDRIAATGVEVREGPDLRLPPGNKVIGASNRAAVSLKAARLLHREALQADLVLVNGVYALPALALARLSIPSVWWVHQVITSRFRLQVVRLTRHAGYFTVAVSEAAAAPVRGMGLVVDVIHNGTPSPVTTAPDRPPETPTVGCAASLTRWKGQDVFLEAVAQTDSRVHAELLGPCFPKDAAYERDLRARCEQSDLSGRVRFLGFRDDVLDVLRTWTVAVSASVEPEAVGLTTLEAMSVGVPVVGTDIGATPTIIDGAGLLVPPGNARAMAQAMSRIVDDDELWRRCHRAGPEQVENRFSLDRQLELTLDYLQRIARRDTGH